MVVYLTEKNNDFSDKYIEIRTKENRILTDLEVEKLPYTENSNPNHKEWRIRKQSSDKVFNYLKNKKKTLQILDIGCGNGWFSHMLSQIENSKVIGLDINSIELEQASRVFNKENLQFFYGDIFEIYAEFENQFDIIIFNASIQYFEDIKNVFSKANTFLKESGEIIIIDSPFYNLNEIEDAKKRTFDYYSKLGVPELAKYYFHHNITDISHFEIIYKPTFFNRKILKKSPFKILKYCKTY